MTVSTTSYSPMTFAGNGSTTVFAVSWPFFTGSLVVSLIDEDDVETIKTISTHYTITGGTAANGTPSTGTVTMLTAPATGETLKIARNTPQNQPTTFVNNDAFPAKTVEATVDRAILVAQESVYKAELAETFASDAEASASEAATQAAAAAVSAASAALVTASLYDDVLNAKSMGAEGDGTTNDTTSLQNAINAAYSLGVPLYIPSGTYMVSGLTWKSGVEIYGASRDATTIKLIANSNTSVIKSDGSDALWGTGSYGGIMGGSIHDLKIDGNWTPSGGGQTAGHGIAVYGSAYRLFDLSIRNCRQSFIKSEWGTYGTDGMEPTVLNIDGDVCGEHGVYLDGPHDGYWDNIILIDPAQKADNTYNGFHSTAKGNGRFISLHPWHRSASTNRMKFAGWFEGWGSQITDCQFEGGRQLLYVGGQQSIIGADTEIYAAFSNSPMVVLGCANTKMGGLINGMTTPGYTPPLIQYGDGVTSAYNIDFDVIGVCDAAASGAIKVVGDGGFHTGTISLIGGANTIFYSGTPATSSDVTFRDSNGDEFRSSKLIVRPVGDVAAVEAAVYEQFSRATPAAFDQIQTTFNMFNSSGSRVLAGRIFMQATSVTAGAENTRFGFVTRAAGVTSTPILFDSAAFYPASAGLISAGTSALPFSAVYSNAVVVGGLAWTSGAGSPEGVVTAPVGSLYTRNNGGAGTTLYVKESGSGNTGWVAK